MGSRYAQPNATTYAHSHTYPNIHSIGHAHRDPHSYSQTHPYPNADAHTLAIDYSDDYSDMVRDLARKHYSRVTRYTTSAFLRVKLGEALRQRGVAPHIFESAEQARAHLLDPE